MCILSVYTLLKVVGYYDLSVLSMSVMALKKFGWGVGGWVETYPISFWDFFNFARPLTMALFVLALVAMGQYTAEVHAADLTSMALTAVAQMSLLYDKRRSIAITSNNIICHYIVADCDNQSQMTAKYSTNFH